MITGSRGSPAKDSEGVTRGLFAASIPFSLLRLNKTKNAKQYLQF